MNDNFKELYEDVDKYQSKITDKVYSEIVDSAKLDWKEPVSTYSSLPSISTIGETRMTRDTGKVYRYDGKTWKEIQEIDASPVNEVDARLTSQLNDTNSQLAQTEQELANQRNEKMDKDTSDISISQINKNKGLIDETYLSDELKQQMAGNTPIHSVPSDGSVTLKKTAFHEIGKNLFNKAEALLDKAINPYNGTISDVTGYFTSDYIKVLPNTMYTRSHEYHLAFYDADKNFISSIHANDNVYTFIPPLNATYLRTSDKLSLIDVYQLEKGSESTPYEEFSMYIPAKYTQKHEIEEKDLPEVEIQNLKEVKKTTNLFDKSTVKYNCRLNMSTGAEIEDSNYATTDYISVQQEEKYIISNVRGVVYYTENKSFLSSVSDVSLKTDYIITIPEGVGYVRFYVYRSTGVEEIIETLQVNKGTEKLPYEEYGYFIPAEYLDLPKYPNLKVPKINLPEKLYVVTGHELNIYFNNVLDYPYEDYQIDITCNIGKQEQRRWTVDAVTAGNYNLKISIYKDYELLTEKTSEVIVVDESVGDSVDVLVLGDSTINQSRATARLLDLTDQDVMDVNLLGTRGSGDNRHEGRGGWTFSKYRTGDVYQDKVNPFYNPAKNDFDFSYYMDEQGYSKVDVVIISLGINDTFGPTSDNALNNRVDTIFNDATHIINSIKSYNNNIKVGICLTIPPNENQDSFGAQYGNDQTQWRYKRNNAIWVNRLIEEYSNDNAVNLIPDNVNIDCIHGFNDDGNGAVHPNETGDKQRGNTFYYWLKSIF